jgi:hypothetical protein
VTDATDPESATIDGDGAAVPSNDETDADSETEES